MSRFGRINQLKWFHFMLVDIWEHPTIILPYILQNPNIDSIGYFHAPFHKFLLDTDYRPPHHQTLLLQP